jgi:putative transposase
LAEHVELLRSAIAAVKLRHPFELPAIVILPEHLHMMMVLPEGNDDFAKRIMLIKQHFSRHNPKTETISGCRLTKGERGIWQRRYWEHCIRDERGFENLVNYIHMNPVKHRWVNKASDWQYSSIHKYIANGMLSPDWGIDTPLSSHDT